MTTQPKPWFVYIIMCEDGTLYTGITTDLNKRFNLHLIGKGARYTRAHKPKQIVYSEQCTNHSAAAIREAEIKKLSREEKVNLTKI